MMRLAMDIRFDSGGIDYAAWQSCAVLQLMLALDLMVVSDSTGIKRRVTYYDMTYNEIDTGDDTPCRRILFLGGSPYNAPAALVMDEDVSNDWEVLHIVRDPLGSITHLIDSDGDIIQELSYDAWGNMRDPVTHEVYDPDNQPELYLLRGYTGHEHLTEFGLINMNARLYDAALGRFLSPDPYVQAPDNTQNFNRYTYCLNNPLRYTDENGEFLTGLIFGFFKGIFRWQNPFKEAWKTSINEDRIIGGLFQLDWSRGFWHCVGEFISRFTWELPQTMVGYTYSMVLNSFTTKVDRVDYFGGATFLTNENHNGGAVTLGNYIHMNIEDHITNDNFKDRVLLDGRYMHEYGHYLDSHKWGLLYLPVIGLSSLGSATFTSTHHTFWTEKRANINAKKYFGQECYGVNWSTDYYNAYALSPDNLSLYLSGERNANKWPNMRTLESEFPTK